MSSENWNSKLSLQNRHHPLSHTWGRDRESAATADNPLCTASVDLRPVPFIPGSGRLLPSSNDTRQTQGRPKSKCETPTPSLWPACTVCVGRLTFGGCRVLRISRTIATARWNSCAPLVHTGSSTLGAACRHGRAVGCAPPGACSLPSDVRRGTRVHRSATWPAYRRANRRWL